MLRRFPFVLPLFIAMWSRGDNQATKSPEDKAGTPVPGHSMYGEAFNEGPRQFAHLLPGTGQVHLPITNKSSDGQAFFDQGVGQLHGFWYFEAERSFRQVAYLDPECAMAYWGMAMANINNPKRAAQFIAEATKRRDHASPREQRWIDAWTAFYAEKPEDEKARRRSLVTALEELIYDHPDELEAKAFLVFQLWDNQQNGVPIPSRLAVDALAQQVIAKAPFHPGAHHYLIHLWNRDEGDKRAVFSAARCGQGAPGIAHLWHMSGHTFSQLKRYQEACWQQEASARVDHAYMNTARIMPEQIHNYAHNNDWLVKNLGYVGRVHDAVALAKNLEELPRLGPNKQQAWRMGRDRLIETLTTFELWDELTSLEPTIYLDADEDSDREIARVRALGTAWFARGERERGQEKLEVLKALQAKKRSERIDAADKAAAKAEGEKKPEPEVTKAMAEALRSYSGSLQRLDRACAELRLYRALAAGDREEARKQLSQASDLPSVRVALIRTELGDFDEATKSARENIKADASQILPHAILVNALARAGKKDECNQALDSLIERSATIDLDLPAIVRIAPIIAERNRAADWRKPCEVPADAGERPELTSLGSFRWHPYRAPDFNLPGKEGVNSSLSSIQGKPTLVVFYLGSGCSRCIEQLNALAPVAPDFQKEGINIVAVSTDSVDGLHRTFELSKTTGSFPFPIVSDHTLQAFHSFRAFDDFENMPLHGSFLIDAEGNVRWQNISYQPFKDVNWLLGESKRLLSIPPAVARSISSR